MSLQTHCMAFTSMGDRSTKFQKSAVYGEAAKSVSLEFSQYTSDQNESQEDCRVWRCD